MMTNKPENVGKPNNKFCVDCKHYDDFDLARGAGHWCNREKTSELDFVTGNFLPSGSVFNCRDERTKQPDMAKRCGLNAIFFQPK
jgi:hypothetical protein